MTPAHEALRIARPRLVEGFSDACTPLDHQGIRALVLHVTTPDVPLVTVLSVDAPEQQGARRVAEQCDPPADRDLVVEILEATGGHDPVEDVLGTCAHCREGVVRGVDERLLDHELVGHRRRTAAAHVTFAAVSRGLSAPAAQRPRADEWRAPRARARWVTRSRSGKLGTWQI